MVSGISRHRSLVRIFLGIWPTEQYILRFFLHHWSSSMHHVRIASNTRSVRGGEIRPLSRGIFPIRQKQAVVRASNIKKNASKAEVAVESGLDLFAAGEAEKALDEFLKAQRLGGSADEMRAAVYNSACAYVKLKKWKDACDALEKAINTYDVKLVVALRDQDLAPLRDRKEWNELLGRVSGGIGNEGYAKLRAEASSPFQFVRLFLFGGLSAGAALGGIVSTARLIAAFGGTYDLQESAKTFGINVACLTVLGFLFARELNSRKKNVQMAAKEEDLAMLQVSVSKDGERSVPLAAFRGMYRPIIIAGSKGQVKKSLAKATKFASLFATRGIVVIPVILNDEDVDEKIQQLKEDVSFSNTGEKGFSKKPATAEAPKEPSKKWKLSPYDVEEWKKWVQSLGIDDTGATTEVYAQVQLDGVVRSSGRGSPPFEKLISDIPELDSMQTRFGDGRGMSKNE